MNEFTVLFKDKTVAHIATDFSADEIIGQKVDGKLHDENGNKITKTGIVEEVLTENN